MLSSLILSLAMNASPVPSADVNTLDIEQIGKKRGLRVIEQPDLIGKKRGLRIGKKRGLRIEQESDLKL